TEGIEQQFFVVPQERDQTATAGKGDESVQDTPAVRSSVDVITQSDQRILRAGPHGIGQGSQGGQAAVDVADRYRAARHAGVKASPSLARASRRLADDQPVGFD